MRESYDFIIVGAGTSGCLLAHRLAHSPAKPSVLLLETGIYPSGPYLTAPFHRFDTAALRPDLDYGYVTEPEPAFGGRQTVYGRGKGVGGCSLVNFCVYLYGSRADYERWGELVGDEEAWGWDSVKASFREIETYGSAKEGGYEHLADASKNGHGMQGRVMVGFPRVLEQGVQEQIEALVSAGEKLNLDPNSGDPMGIAVFPASVGREGRCTSASAHLVGRPGNLEVWTEAKVERLVWGEGVGKRVVGIVTEDGREATAKNEVLLCAGAIDTPKLLLLNGIGPASELSALGIEVKHDLPGVGKHLQDHVLTFMSVEVLGTTNARHAFETSPTLITEAEEAWARDQSGAFLLHYSSLWGGFLKLPDLESFPEYAALPQDMQDFLAKPTVPSYEFASNMPLWPPGTELEQGNTYMTLVTFLMNPMSSGSVTLRSANASCNPIITLNYLTHPYDARILREGIRSTWTKLVDNPVIAPSVVRTLLGPKSMTDVDIDAFVRENANTVRHANGTVKMGKRDDAGACVDSGFRVLGVQGLRVVDMSVAPITTNNHTQATAYLIAQKAAEKLVGEYGLDEIRDRG
ncbi:choline dehydrogenase [Clathrospora elynae]|uniref:Choline dehydrogenase n=1 Tax=Clathrospora elynae TaxID=706981 RepID=A0A6A5SG08_9PLEO|nr:choline dehydrogenase [Clathrospora elynae]